MSTLDKLADRHGGRRDPAGCWHWSNTDGPAAVIEQLGDVLDLPDNVAPWHLVLSPTPDGRLQIEVEIEASAIPGFRRVGPFRFSRSFNAPVDQRPLVERAADFDPFCRCVRTGRGTQWFLRDAGRWRPATARQVTLELRNRGLSPRECERAMYTASACPWRIGSRDLRSFNP